MSMLEGAYSAVVVLLRKVAKIVFYSSDLFGILNAVIFLT